MSQIFDERGNAVPVTLFEPKNRDEVSVFKEGDKVKISGISKGKGFQGAVKRWGFKGRGQTHGVKHEHRTIGSVGTSFPERVIKGKKMPGRMGRQRVTVKNLKVVKVDLESNIIAVKGAVPGPRGSLLEVRG
ncbi:MAG: large subunit ribosomal protein L3 [Parcubacteria group bacterium Gr01-1014_30]|nr:MAG: large subunit ribosomal protein L3 [Parcubacteria group bacterium Gr01-1014_30]